MTIRPIRSETDCDAALAEIDRLMGVDPDTPESDRLEVLVTLVEKYGWCGGASQPRIRLRRSTARRRS